LAITKLAKSSPGFLRRRGRGADARRRRTITCRPSLLQASPEAHGFVGCASCREKVFLKVEEVVDRLPGDVVWLLVACLVEVLGELGFRLLECWPERIRPRGFRHAPSVAPSEVSVARGAPVEHVLARKFPIHSRWGRGDA
jgi:hypothetical protein